MVEWFWGSFAAMFSYPVVRWCPVGIAIRPVNTAHPTLSACEHEGVSLVNVAWRAVSRRDIPRGLCPTPWPGIGLWLYCVWAHTHTHTYRDVFTHATDPGASVAWCVSVWHTYRDIWIFASPMYLFLLFQVSYIHGLAVFQNYLYATHSDTSGGSSTEVLQIHRFNTTEPKAFTSLGNSRGICVYHKLTQPKGKDEMFY